MKKLVLILTLVAAMFTIGCKEKETEVAIADALTNREEIALLELIAEGDVGIQHLERYLAELNSPEGLPAMTRPWPSCWGRRIAKIEAVCMDFGVTVKDVEEFIAIYKEDPQTAE